MPQVQVRQYVGDTSEGPNRIKFNIYPGKDNVRQSSCQAQLNVDDTDLVFLRHISATLMTVSVALAHQLMFFAIDLRTRSLKRSRRHCFQKVRARESAS